MMGFYFNQSDPEKISRYELAEREKLEKLKGSMSEEDLTELTRVTRDLRLKQDTLRPPAALKAVPSFSLESIPKKPIQVPIQVV